MARIIKTQDGIVLKGIPEGVSDDEIKQRINTIRSERDAPVPKEPKQAALENIAGNPVYRAVSAVGEPLVGAAELAARKLVDPFTSVMGYGKPVGDYIAGNIDERNKLIEAGREKRGESGFGFDPYRLAGNVVAPLGAASKYNVGKALLEKAVGGAVIGGGTAMTMPVGGNAERFDEKKVDQAVVGGGFGAAIPVVGAGLGKIGGAIDGVYRYLTNLLMDTNKKAGGAVISKSERSEIYKDIKEFMMNKSGADRQKIIRAMQNADEGQTAGQAIAKANNLSDDVYGGQFVRLERDLSQVPVSGDKIKKIYKGQIEGEKAALDKLSGTDDALDIGQKLAKKKASDTYGDVTDDLLSIDKELFSRPSVVAGIKEAKRSALETGSYFPEKAGDKFSVGNLQRIKQAIAEKITTEKRAGSIGKSTEKEMNDTLNQFVDLLRKKSPGFAKAEDEFIKNMKPVNAMKVGRELRDNYSNNIDGLTGGKFITAVQNPKKTVKKATGFRGAKSLPEGFDETSGIVRAIQNRARAKEMAKNTKSIMNDLTGEVEINLPNMLSRPVLLTNAALKMISKDKTPEYKAILTQAYTDPKKFERLLTENAKSPKRAMAEDILKKLTTISIGAESGRAAGEN